MVTHGVPQDLLLVSEIFGPTIQGEGPNSGRLAWFVRLGGCNLSCSWCDTPYTWDSTRFRLRDELRHRSVGAIVSTLPAGCLVILTGGEPLLQQELPAWHSLLLELRNRECVINMETNGTIAPNASTRSFVDLSVVSPKLPNAGRHRGHQEPSLHPAWTEVASDGRAVLKIVCQSTDDVSRAHSLAQSAGWPSGATWVMPEGNSTETLNSRWPEVVNAAISFGLNVSNRLHVLTWGANRGH